MTPIAAPAPAPKAPPAPPKAADRDDRFAALVDDSDDAPQAKDAPAPKDAPTTKPAPATTAAATSLAAVIAAANGEATPAPAADAPAAPEAKPEGEAPADLKAEAKPADEDAPTPPPAAALPIAAPVLAATPTPLAPAPHVSAPTTKAAPKDEKVATTTATDAKATHATPAPAEAPPAKAETAPTGDFKAALDATITPAQPNAATAHMPDAPVVTVRPGQMAADAGIQIARQINAGQNEFLLRLNPAEHGHIQIHMRFAEDGALRAVISADSATVLDMLRKDSGDLTRALGDAGVRTDAQSFSFGSQGQDGQRNPRGTPQGSAQGWNQTATDQTEDTPLTRFRPLHGGLGVLDRLA
jgi:flagellar hook-length control protein FliK